MSKQLNVRLPDKTSEQMQKIIKSTGMTQVQLVIVAIDRYFQEEERSKEMAQHVIGIEFESFAERKDALPALNGLFENVSQYQNNKQGIHVICSKPIGKTYDEAFEICKQKYFECGWINVDSL